MERFPVAARVWLGATLVLAGPWLFQAAAWPLEEERVAKTHVIEIRGFTYSPSSLIIAAGDTVVWINRDIVPHSATAEAGGWDSGTIAPSGSWRHVFTARGQSKYLCTLHPTMKSVLTVR